MVLNVSMILNNLEEVCVFASVSDFAPRPVGLIRHTVEIPGDFLNAGCYYLNMLIVKDASTGILFQNNVASFRGRRRGSCGQLVRAVSRCRPTETEVGKRSNLGERFCSDCGSQHLV